MIDPADKQTQALPLEQPKRGRGRPATGKALSDAERARRYRANKKNRDAQPSRKEPPSIPADGVKEILDGWQCTQKELDQALQRIAELEAELASRVTKNEETEAKTWRVEFLPAGKRKWIEATKGETFTTERKAQVRKANYLEKHPKISAEQLRIVCVTSRK
ncbi:hypothetical protein ACWDYW_003601 [Pseudomonas aeruginosa]|nr:hypothetical protein [Pseudomonas aeruginosa]HCF2915587.1 hypothetical protein [Pseudomonas aeruginosa]